MTETMPLEAPTQENLADNFLTAWQAAHGVSPGNARVTLSKYGITILIENALHPAEVELAARQNGNRFLEPYLRSLLATVAAEQAAFVQAACGRGVSSHSECANYGARWVAWFFELGEPAPDGGRS